MTSLRANTAQKDAQERPRRSTRTQHRREDKAKPAPCSSVGRAAGNLAVQRLLRARAIQATPTINQPDDPYEREADRIAERVTRMPAPAVQRTCTCGGTCAECSDEEVPVVQRKAEATGGDAPTPATGSVIPSGGRSLDRGTRSFFEPRLGRSLGGVRVHTGAEAAALAGSLEARAYTVGRDVVFGEGEYQPESHVGRRLLAHELVHVLQQGAGGPVRARAPGKPHASPGSLRIARKAKRHGSAVTARALQVRTTEGDLYVLPAGSPVGYTEDVPEQSYTIYYRTGPHSAASMPQIPRAWLDALKEEPSPTLHKDPRFAEEEAPVSSKLPDELSFLSWDPSKAPPKGEAQPVVGGGYLKETKEGRIWVSENGFLYYPDAGSKTLFKSKSPTLFYSTAAKAYFDYQGNRYATEKQALDALGSDGELRTTKHVRDETTGEERFELTDEGMYQANRRLYLEVLSLVPEQPGSAPEEPSVPDQCDRDCQVLWNRAFVSYWRDHGLRFQEGEPVGPDFDPPDLGGTPRGNRRQNRQFRDAVREAERKIDRQLSKDEIRRLHDEITGRNYDYHQIVETAVDMFGG